MFAIIGRSWNFAKLSYRIALDNKQLLIFPIVSAFSALFVILSFILPLWGLGAVDYWLSQMSEGTFNENDPVLYLLLFGFYFINYFIIVFFNTALTLCTMKIFKGEEANFFDGFEMAAERIPQIIGWALFSAFVGVILNMIERAHEKVGELVAAFLGSAWTALTYFVVPVIAAEGVGPIKAFKSSVVTLKKTWGDALIGNFSMGLAGIVMLCPIYLGAIGLIVIVFASPPGAISLICMLGAMILFVIGAVISGAADHIFKVVLYYYAEGRELPAYIDTIDLSDAFRPKK